MSISNETCVGQYNQTLRNQLYSMSDHLPVVMKMETNKEFILQNQDVSFIENIIINNTLVTDNLLFKLKNSSFDKITIHLYNVLGQKIKTVTGHNNEMTEISTSDLKSGFYYLMSDELNGVQKILKI